MSGIATIRVLRFNTSIDLSGFDRGLKQMQARTATLSKSIGRSLTTIKAPAINTSAFDASLRRMQSQMAASNKTMAKAMAGVMKSPMSRVKAPAIPTQKVPKSALAGGVAGMVGKSMASKAISAKMPAPSGMFGGVGTTLASIAPMATGIGTALGGIGAGLGAVNIVKTAANMEKRIAGLGKAANLSGGDLAGMKDQIFGLSKNLSGVPINDLVDIATTGAKLGVVREDLIRYTEGVARVSTAIDDLPASVVSEEIGKLQTVFKLGIQGTLQFGSAIDKVADSGISSAAGILDVSQRISGSAVAAKISAQETVALAGALLDTGTHAELAATTLTTLINNLNDVKRQKGFASTIGVSADKFATVVRNKPIVAIQEFLKSLDKMDAAGQNQALASVGIKGVLKPGEIKKLASVGANLSKYIADANHEFLTLDQITNSYNATAGLTTSKWTNFENEVEILKDTVGSKFLPTINTALDTLGGWTGKLGGMFDGVMSGLAPLLPPLREFGATIAGAFSGVGSTLTSFVPSFSTVVGAIGSGITWLKGAFVTVVETIKGIPTWIDATFGEGMANKVGGFAVVVGGVAAAIAGAVLVVPALTAGFVALAPVVTGAIGVLTSAPVVIGGIATALGIAGVSVAAFTGNLPTLSQLVDGVGFAFRNFGDLAQLSFLKVGAALDGFWGNLKLIPQNFLTIAKFIGGNFVELTMSALSVVGQGVRDLAKAVWDFLSDPTAGFKFDLSKTFAQVAELKKTMATMPALEFAKGADISGRVAEIDAKIRQREDAYAQGKAQEAARARFVGPPMISKGMLANNPPGAVAPSPTTLPESAKLPQPPTSMLGLLTSGKEVMPGDLLNSAMGDIARRPASEKSNFYANSGRRKPAGWNGTKPPGGVPALAGGIKPEYFANSGRRKPAALVAAQAAASFVGPPIAAMGSGGVGSTALASGGATGMAGAGKKKDEGFQFAATATLGSTEAYKSLTAAFADRTGRGDDMRKDQRAHTKAQKDGNKLLKGIKDSLEPLKKFDIQIANV